ncbi:MAG: hypothetical protein U0166_11180 [Acidobacteriota bacterium]
MLMLSAAMAVARRSFRDGAPARRVRPRSSASIFFWIVTAIFGYTLGQNVHERPDGVYIASVFILVIVVAGGVSRYMRSTELRVSEIHFADDASAELWKGICGKKVNLVPLRVSTPAARGAKAAELRRHYAIKGPLAFLHVNLIDNRSDFITPLRLKVTQDEEEYRIEVWGAIAIANTIAYVSELLDPKSLFLGLTGENLITQAFRYLLWGEGEVGLLVYKILLRYWEWTPEQDVRPLIFLMSE